MAMLFLMQQGAVGCLFCKGDLLFIFHLPTSTSTYFFARLLCSQLAHGVYWCMGLFLPKVQDCAVHFVVFSGHFCWRSSPASWGPSVWQHTHGTYHPFSQLCMIWKYGEGALCLIFQVTYEEAKQSRTQYQLLEYTAADQYTTASSWASCGSTDV